MKIIKFLFGITFVIIWGCSGDDNVTEIESSTRYRLTFNATWSVQSHPNNFPSGPHFSGLIGMTHSENVTLFNEGALASDGIKNMAETGSKNPLTAEIQGFISNGSADGLISGGGVSSSPGEVSVEFDIITSNSFVSVVSMLAPSPDWFIAVSNVSLIENDNWINQKTVGVDIYDAGTDSGVNFTSANQSTAPKENIVKITVPPLAVNGVVTSLGTITFERIQ